MPISETEIAVHDIASQLQMTRLAAAQALNVPPEKADAMLVGGDLNITLPPAKGNTGEEPRGFSVLTAVGRAAQILLMASGFISPLALIAWAWLGVRGGGQGEGGHSPLSPPPVLRPDPGLDFAPLDLLD